LKINIPTEWRLVLLSEVASVQTGLAKGKAVNGRAVELPYLRVANVQDGHIDLREVKTICVAPKDIARYSLRPGDVLFTEGGDFDKLGRGAVWRGEIPICLHQNHVFAVRPSPDKLLPEFLSALSSSAYGRRYFLSSSKQTTNLASINSTQLKEFPIPLPSLAEQRKIAAILRTWDEAIEKLRALREAKQRQFRWLLRRIMNDTVRGVVRDGWQEVAFGEILTESRIPDTVNDPRKRLTVRLHVKGVVAREFRGTEAKDATLYFIRKSGQFVYGKQNIFRGAVGIVPPELDGYASSQDIPAFDIHEKVDSQWLLHLFSYPSFYKKLEAYASGSGSKRLHPKDLFKLKISIPPLSEQKYFVEILNSAKRETTLLESLEKKYKYQKRGLMQKLLTGEWRVKTDEANRNCTRKEAQNAE